MFSFGYYITIIKKNLYIFCSIFFKVFKNIVQLSYNYLELLTVCIALLLFRITIDVLKLLSTLYINNDLY